MSYLTAGPRAGAVGEICRIGHLDIRSTNSTEAMAKFVRCDDVLRRSRIHQADTRGLRRGNALLHPQVEIVEGRVENQTHEAGFHQRNFRLAFRVEWPVDGALRASD